MNDAHNPSEGEDHPSDDETLHQQLLELVDRACQHPRGSLQRNRYLNRLIRDIEKSGKLWKENTDYYGEALHKTWIYLSGNLCEASTAKQPYDRTKARITTWLQAYLEHRLRDEAIAEQKANQNKNIRDQRLVSLDDEEEDDGFKPSEKIPATPDLTFYMEEILEWIETDPTGELKSNHLPRKRDITCQVLLQRKCSSGQSMEQLAAELNCAPCTLYKFFKSHCVPLLQKFCEDQGYQLTISGVYHHD
jgi:AraC-like DNA-binding protein